MIRRGEIVDMKTVAGLTSSISRVESIVATESTVDAACAVC